MKRGIGALGSIVPTLVGVWVGMGWMMAQSLGIQSAVELRLPTEEGRVHRWEVSRDLVTWKPVETGILGDGRPLTRWRQVTGMGPEYFRMSTDEPLDLAALLEPIRVARKVPALAAVVMQSNRVVAMGAVGVRRTGTDVAVTLGDRWHHGSLTKSMTATLAAILVQEGRLTWQSTVGGVLGDAVPGMHADWRGVTLDQLLRHRGGAPDQAYLTSRGYWAQMWDHKGTPEQQRLYCLRSVTTNAPQVSPGTSYVYSNAGYVFAGMMLEKVMGKAWEDLMVERLFAPLGMETAGFGVPARPRFLDQPWGHRWTGGLPSAVFPGNDADNPSGLGPAGTVHCSLLDLGKYAMFHAREGRGEEDPLVTPESFEALHIPKAGETYAYGWGQAQRVWAGGRVHSHTGSNVQWYSNLWVAPMKDGAIIAITNIGDNTGSVAAQTTDEVVGKLVGYLK